MRNARHFAALLGVVMLLMFGVVSTASASTRHYFGALKWDINYGGKTGYFYTDRWVGNCDYYGYHYDMQWLDDNTSSLTDMDPWDGCNYVILKDATGTVCGEGYIPMRYVGNNCNDRIEHMQIVQR